MIRKTPASSMQKTYDECYLTCSTAIYFEGQNNEAEALRAWRNALDTIYYHNAYKIPSGYQPRSETEKALQDSLRAMELQCKERVDLLDALKKSREEADQDAKSKSKESLKLPSVTRPSFGAVSGESSSGLGNGTVPQTTYADLPRPSPGPSSRPAPLPPRPSYRSRKTSTEETPRTKSLGSNVTGLAPPISSSELPTRDSRTPSPEKKGTMLRTLRSNPKDSSRMSNRMKSKPPSAAANAATKVWTGGSHHRPSAGNSEQANGSSNGADSNNNTSVSWDPYTRKLVDRRAVREPDTDQARRRSDNNFVRPPSPSDYLKPRSDDPLVANSSTPIQQQPPYPDYPLLNPYTNQAFSHSEESFETAHSGQPPPPPPHASSPRPFEASAPQHRAPSPPSISKLKPTSISYMREYPDHPPSNKRPAPAVPAKPSGQMSDSERASKLAAPRTVQAKSSPTIPRKSINSRAVGVASATVQRQQLDNMQASLQKRVNNDPSDTLAPGVSANRPSTAKNLSHSRNAPTATPEPSIPLVATVTDLQDSIDENQEATTASDSQSEWEDRSKNLLKHLPRGVDEASAKQILNEIVIKGDEVHWDDVAGLEIAKGALKETVVYPFLRPDLFMGLREPARGMLLFGPPGTGKTMLARAVATESKSVFFAISASSLTSKFLGESEKLVRALFVCAKALAPSIIFVDEIDSLLGSRGGGSEHEATRRIKTEFLIQWSDLQKAAAGRESSEGDATRVLVLAATNLPWAIDEAARRRFVRRQYIPLPEEHVRESQLRTLLSAQKHSVSDFELKQLVVLTEGFSGSDITALAKDAAMGPLRSLGEQLLHMSPEDIRPISVGDFKASLGNIRPSVSRQGLKEFEDWAREFGERGG